MTALKICLIVLLCILGLIVFLSLLILFFPIVYRIAFSYHENMPSGKITVCHFKVFVFSKDKRNQKKQKKKDSDAETSKEEDESEQESESKSDTVPVILEELKSEDVRNMLLDCMKRSFRFIKKILPRKIKGNLYFGTGSPDTTGYILGLICMFYGVYSPSFTVSADFEEKRLECNVFARGRVFGIEILLFILSFIRNKECMDFYHKVRKGGNKSGSDAV